MPVISEWISQNATLFLHSSWNAHLTVSWPFVILDTAHVHNLVCVWPVVGLVLALLFSSRSLIGFSWPGPKGHVFVCSLSFHTSWFPLCLFILLLLIPFTVVCHALSVSSSQRLCGSSYALSVSSSQLLCGSSWLPRFSMTELYPPFILDKFYLKKGTWLCA